jgi:hypothetical protein
MNRNRVNDLSVPEGDRLRAGAPFAGRMRRMTEPPVGPAAWVLAVRMGYGHQRTAHPLRGLAPGGEVLFADDYPGIPDRDKAVWRRTRRLYDLISNVQQVPVVGNAAFSAFDVLQRILRFYPRRDLSHPDWNVRALYGMIRRGWGRDLIDRLRAHSPVLPIVTSFFTPAFMAEHFDYPGDIYCIVCDADIARAWAPLAPRASRIKYFAPTRRAAERLRLYGVPADHVVLTGYPLPEENIGGPDFAVLRHDLADRIVTLDPQRRYLERYEPLVANKVGRLPAGPTRPLTILFSFGGAGAQKDIAAMLIRGLKPRIQKGEVRLVISAGVKPEVRDYAFHAAEECGLPVDGTGVDVLFEEKIAAYFERFNLALRTTDILWTKPSELSFYSALGLPIVLAPPLGSQEWANQEWLLRLGAGTRQEDVRYVDEWLFDLVESGWFAEAAVEGFVEGTAAGSLEIRAVLEAKGVGSN